VRDCVANGDALGAVELTALDQDPAALAFVRGWLPDTARPATRLICGPVRDVLGLVDQHAPRSGGQFDLVISTGLFDYLDDSAARRLLPAMCRLARPGGSIAVCNFAPEDPSRIEGLGRGLATGLPRLVRAPRARARYLLGVL
jgi:SAM-dependent methyltransferase